jgi:hypothetical protein
MAGSLVISGETSGSLVQPSAGRIQDRKFARDNYYSTHLSLNPTIPSYLAISEAVLWIGISA